MLVTIRVFSGRLDPAWHLSSQQSAQLVEMLESSTMIKAHNLNPEPLGYSGFRISQIENMLPGVEEIVVAKGLISLKGGRKKVTKSDDERKIERWLLETGSGTIDQQIFRDISKMLA